MRLDREGEESMVRRVGERVGGWCLGSASLPLEISADDGEVVCS